MIKVSVMYPNVAAGRFDMRYYSEKHMPMVRELLGAALKGIAVDQGVAGGMPGAPAPYLAMGHLLFDSVEAFQAAFGPHAQTLMSDIPNYTNTQPVIQISEVKL
ncbi:MAG TPA: EthD family reductase [Candidatus Acidoferrum sp.]|nr:EthD family reductase [Candidatus Acidoferrum sp.]